MNMLKRYALHTFRNHYYDKTPGQKWYDGLKKKQDFKLLPSTEYNRLWNNLEPVHLIEPASLSVRHEYRPGTV